MRFLVFSVLVAMPFAAHAQAHGAACGDSTTYFEFQVTQPARWIPDSGAVVHPTAHVRNPDNLVQFVVDTAGAPVARTFHAVKGSDPTILADARVAIAQWRFSPARLNGCPIRQLVQTPIGR